MSAQAYFLVRHGVSEKAFELREIPDPTPGAGEVLIQSEASGLNFADVMARQGLYADAPPIPSIVGYEVVGRILALGPSPSTGLKVGMRVLAFVRFGGYASKVVATEAAVVQLGNSLDAATATALAVQGVTAYYAAEEMTRLHQGDVVLIQAAAGGVGSLLVQMVKRRGAFVLGTAGSAEKLSRLKELGLDVGISYRDQDFAEVVREELKKKGESGLDVVFDSLGGSHVRKGFGLLRAGGRMVCFGAANMSGDSKNPIRILKTAASFGLIHHVQLLNSSRSVIGINMLRVADQRPWVLNRCMKEVVGMADRGEIKPWKATQFPAAEIAKAHDLLSSRGSSGKVAIVWS